jgi:AraC-like DNA-binding protein/DNA gyrase inhibitor GyrI
MTVYEQIQRSVDFIEERLQGVISSEEVARKANMSLRSFYNYFWAVTGFRYGEYLRKRRMSEALKLLTETENKVVDIALNLGYESHEAFTRAFKSEFDLSPIKYRKGRPFLDGLKKINIIEEMYMGIVIKKLEDMNVVCYTGFSPEPEDEAHERLGKWAKENGYGDQKGNEEKKPFRLFGHDTDSQGQGFSANNNYENYGYKLMLTLKGKETLKDKDLTLETIKGGRFAVTGVEGDPDKAGEFIPEGWQKMMKMIEDKGYKPNSSGRWFEEELNPSKPGLLRLDLYLELEE